MPTQGGVLTNTGLPYAAGPTTAVSPGMATGKFPPASAPITGSGYQVRVILLGIVTSPCVVACWFTQSVYLLLIDFI